MIWYLFVKFTVHIEWMYSNCPYNVLSYVAYISANLQRPRVSTMKKKNINPIRDGGTHEKRDAIETRRFVQIRLIN